MVLEADGQVARAALVVVIGVVVLAGLIGFVATRAVLPLIITIIGLVVLAFRLPSFLQYRKWRTPEFHIDRWPLELGGRPTITYRLRPKRPSNLPPAPVELSISCTEVVRYSVGSESRTDRATVYRQQATATGEVTADGFEATFDMAIPVDAGAPSLDLGSNDITWHIEAEITGKGYPGGTRQATVVVVPVLDLGVASFWGGR